MIISPLLICPYHVTRRKEREIDKKEREIERQKGATQIFCHHRIPNQKFKLTLISDSPPMNTLSFRFLLNFLNTNACDTEIEKEGKKTLRYRDEKETEFVPTTVRCPAKIIPPEPAPVT